MRSFRFIIIPLVFLLFLVSFSTADASSVYYPLTNHQGSVVALTNENGEVVARNSYYPYGNTLTEEGEQNLQERGYTGQRKDSKVDIYYYNARYYDPSLSSFLSADTKDDQLNRYQYVAGNPVNKIDPSGNQGSEIPVTNEFIPMEDLVIQQEFIRIRNEYVRQRRIAANVLESFPNLNYQSQKEVGEWACLPTSWAMLADMFSPQEVNANDVAQLWHELGMYNPDGGMYLQSAINYTRSSTDFNSLSGGAYGLLQVNEKIKEYGQPAIVSTTIGHEQGRGGHFSVFLGIDDNTGHAMFFDPYLYKTNLDKNKMFVAKNILFVDFQRAQAAFQSTGGVDADGNQLFGGWYIFLNIPTVGITESDNNYNHILSDIFHMMI